MYSMFNITHACLSCQAETMPDKVALIIANRQGTLEKWSYKQLYDAVSRLAVGLQALNYPKGTRIVIRSLKNSDFLLLFFACMAIGWVPISSLSNLSGEEELFTIEDSQAQLFYQHPDISLDLPLPEFCRTFSFDQLQKLKQYEFQPLPLMTDKEDVAFMLYTSGSTSKPKGVMHAHRVLLGREPMRRYYLDLQINDVVMHSGKPCWTYGMGVAFFDTWFVGATAVVNIDEHDPGSWFDLIERYQITLFASSPSVLKQIRTCDNRDGSKIKSLRCAVSAGEKLPDEIVELWKSDYDKALYESLGMSEFSTFISTGPTVPRKAGTIGKLQPGRDVRLLPIEGGMTPVSVGQSGLLAVNKNNEGFMLGYWTRADSDQQRYRGDWFLSGDVLHQDVDGYFYYEGRYDDILNVAGGHRVSPVEIENCIFSSGLVKSVLVGLLADGEADNQLAAYVVPINSDQTDQQHAAAIMQQCRQHLSGNKIPNRLVFVDDLIKNRTGKVDRKAVSSLHPLSQIYRF